MCNSCPLSNIQRMHYQFKVLIILIFSLIISAKVLSQTDDSLTYPKINLEIRQEIGEKFTKHQIEVKNLNDSIILFLDTLDAENLRDNSLMRKDIREYISLLIKSQSEWANYTESMCKIDEYQSRHGAQGGTTFYYICKTDYAEKRIIELKDLFFNIQLEFKSW